MEINCGKGIVVNVDESRFNGAVNEYVFRYGLKQMLSDCHASIKKDDYNCKSLSLALVQKKLDALYNGETTAERSRLDPIESEARRLALAAIQDKVRKAGKKLNVYDNDWYAARCDENWEKFAAQARRIVEIRKAETQEVEIDL